jgi:DNA-binding MarR family transcriptional regulator
MYKKKTNGKMDPIEKKIITYLKKHPEGTMMLDLADAIGVHRHTVTKYVYRLEGMSRIVIRKIGIAKLCYFK